VLVRETTSRSEAETGGARCRRYDRTLLGKVAPHSGHTYRPERLRGTVCQLTCAHKTSQRTFSQRS